MAIISQTVTAHFGYRVCFTTALFCIENPLLANAVGQRKVLVVVDDGVARHHPRLVAQVAEYCRQRELELVAAPLVLPGGEQVKNDPAYVLAVQEAIHRYGICRHSAVVAIGGGALLDMVGYAAATAHRGVRLVRVPTTVLAQNDSAVGVKNSVNAFGKKNFLGTFAPPAAVLADVDFLTTLDDRDWRGGTSEAVKVALLKDPAFFAFIEQQAPAICQRQAEPMRHLVIRCAELHLDHIARSGDPFEQGSSRPLDFGHWAAHKLEQLTAYELRHGEAVAIGIALDSTYAYLSGMLPEAHWRRILDCLAALGLSVFHPFLRRALDTPDDPRCVLRGLDEFREHLGGQLTIMLLETIGRGVEVHSIDYQRMAQAIGLLAHMQDARVVQLEGAAR